jgi:hypothetical protein
MKKYLIPLIIFVLSAIYYIIQACPTFYFWDSAELTAAVISGGVPHPPGFPLLLLLAKAFSAVMPLSPAYGLNIFSAIFGAIGLALWYLISIKLLKKAGIIRNERIIALYSFLSVIVMGISLTYGIQATRFEVYSLNFAGFAALFLIALKIIDPQPKSIWQFLFFALFGLLLGLHNLTIVLAFPGLLLLIYLHKNIRISQIISGLILSAAIALMLYLTILIRAGSSPLINWGDPSKFGRLIDFILVKGFSTSTTRLTGGHLLELFQFTFMVLVRQIGFPALLIALVGIIYLVRQRLVIGLPLFILMIFNLISVGLAENYFYENYDLHGYLMISLAVNLLFFAAGFIFLSALLSKRVAKNKPLTSAIILGVVAILLFIVPIKDNFLSADLSHVKTPERFARLFLESAPADAIVITSSYNTYFTCLALKSIDSRYSKRAVLNLYNWDHKWGRDDTDKSLRINLSGESSRQGYYREFLNKFLKTVPIYFEYDISSAPIAAYLRPRGLGYIFAPSDSSALDSTSENDIIKEAMSATELESIRTWVLWAQNRGEYFEKRSMTGDASKYYSLVENLAAKADLK